MGRHQPEIKKVGVKVRVSEPLYAKLTLLLYDPVRKRIHYGDLTRLLEHLLSKWVLDQLLERKNGRQAGQEEQENRAE
jgi:hypothetical protein